MTQVKTARRSQMQRYGVFIALIMGLVLIGCGSDPIPTVLPTNTPPPVIPLTDIALRTGPSFSYDVAAQVAKNEAVALLGVARGRDCEDWVLVRTGDGVEGWTAPVLVNVDVERSIIPPAPTPVIPATPMPETCTDDLGLVQITNNVGITLEVYMAGPEPGFAFSVDAGASQFICVAPGEYCYDLTDGEEHETGNLSFVGGECTCWYWGSRKVCNCPEDLDSYQRP